MIDSSPKRAMPRGIPRLPVLPMTTLIVMMDFSLISSKKRAAIPKLKQQEAQRLGRNKARLIQNAAGLSQEERVTALRQAAREVRDARKAFGPHVAAGVRDDFRTIAKQVPPVTPVIPTSDMKTKLMNAKSQAKAFITNTAIPAIRPHAEMAKTKLTALLGRAARRFK